MPSTDNRFAIPGVYDPGDPMSTQSIPVPFDFDFRELFRPYVNIAMTPAGEDDDRMLRNLVPTLSSIFGWRGLREWAPNLFVHHLMREGMDAERATAQGERLHSLIDGMEPRVNYTSDAHTRPSFWVHHPVAAPDALSKQLITTLTDIHMQEERDIPDDSVMDESWGILRGLVQGVALVQGTAYASMWLHNAVMAAAVQAGYDDENAHRIADFADDCIKEVEKD